MLQDKLVKCIEKNTDGGRLRKVYSITKQGLFVLKQWLVTPPQETTARLEFMLKLFYGKNLSQERYIAHIQQQQVSSEEKLKFYLTKQKHIQEEHSNIDAFYWLQTLRRAIYHTKADIAWCKDTLSSITPKR